MELLSAKIGWVLLILGAMHFFNLYVFAKLRTRALKPPVIPQQVMESYLKPAQPN